MSAPNGNAPAPKNDENVGNQANPEAGGQAPFMSPNPAQVFLKHPHSNVFSWVLTGVYFLVAFVSVPLLGLLLLLTMPMGVGIDNPRRALHLWATGLVSAGVFISHARSQVLEMGGVEAAWQVAPLSLAGWVGGSLIAVLVIIWHLTWIESPLSQSRRK